MTVFQAVNGYSCALAPLDGRTEALLCEHSPHTGACFGSVLVKWGMNTNHTTFSWLEWGSGGRESAETP